MSLNPAAEWTAAQARQTRAERERLQRWLRITPTDPGAFIASLMAVRMDTDDGLRVALAYPPPLPFNGEGVYDDATVILIDPTTDTAALHRDSSSALVGDGPALFASPTAFAVAWARERLRFIQMTRDAKLSGFVLTEPADGCAPGALLIGDPFAVRWPTGMTFTCDDEGTTRAANAAILQTARLSRVLGAQPHVRAA